MVVARAEAAPRSNAAPDSTRDSWTMRIPSPSPLPWREACDHEHRVALGASLGRRAPRIPSRVCRAASFVPVPWKLVGPNPPLLHPRNPARSLVNDSDVKGSFPSGEIPHRNGDSAGVERASAEFDGL